MGKLAASAGHHEPGNIVINDMKRRIDGLRSMVRWLVIVALVAMGMGWWLWGKQTVEVRLDQVDDVAAQSMQIAQKNERSLRDFLRNHQALRKLAQENKEWRINWEKSGRLPADIEQDTNIKALLRDFRRLEDQYERLRDRVGSGESLRTPTWPRSGETSRPPIPGRGVD